jgi:hypothetical protein
LLRNRELKDSLILHSVLLATPVTPSLQVGSTAAPVGAGGGPVPMDTTPAAAQQLPPPMMVDNLEALLKILNDDSSSRMTFLRKSGLITVFFLFR